jgi:hypothetical protein
MRRIARRGAALTVSAWVLSMGFAMAEDGTRTAGGLKGRAGTGLQSGRVRQSVPEWAGPPIEIPPPCVADGTPSRLRELKLESPRVKVLSIQAVPEPSGWAPAAGQPAYPRKGR